MKNINYNVKNDTFVFITTTSSSITLSLTGNGLMVAPISTGIACGITITK